MAQTWQTSLTDVCGEPGGSCLMIKAVCLPCLVFGDLNAYVDGPCGWFGGCISTMVCGFPAYLIMMNSSPKIADKSGFEESMWWALIMTCIPCVGCMYMCQVHREMNIQKNEGVPAQQKM